MKQIRKPNGYNLKWWEWLYTIIVLALTLAVIIAGGWVIIKIAMGIIDKLIMFILALATIVFCNS